MRKRTKRIYGILLCMSMLLTLLKVPVLAAEPVEIGEGYEKAQEQEQKEQEHEHTESCYTQTENCVHEHTSECYPQTTGTGTVSGNDITETIEDQPTECTHVCSEESGCITKELNCLYENENGSILKNAEMPQENETKIAVLSGTQEAVTVESVQAMIDALPDAKDINDNNIEEVKIQYRAIVDAMAQLSPEEVSTLDILRYLKVAAVLNGPFFGVPTPIPGTDLEWVISQYDDRTLTISGKGEMPDFGGTGEAVCPWEKSKIMIKKVIIEEGVTNIGNNAFNGCSKLTEVHISKTVKTIGDSAFKDCTALTQIDIPDSVKSVGSFTFVGCTGLKEVHTHWKSSDDINFGLFVFYEYGASWPQNRIIYVPAGYMANFKSSPKGAWGSWNVQGENYTVSFDGGNASGFMEPVQASGDYTLPDCGFTYESANFEYWALENSDGKKAGGEGDVFPVTEDVVFYANWTLVIVIEPEDPIIVCIHEWSKWASNGNGTHTHTCSNDNSHTETKNCSGGTATCQSGAVCETCKTAYGGLDAGNHTGGTEVRGRVEATTGAAGYTGDAWCLGCNTKIASGQTIPKKESSSESGTSGSGNSENGNSGNSNSSGNSESSNNSGSGNSGSGIQESRNDIQQDIPSSKPKAAPAQLIAGDNTKTVSKDNGQSLIANYKPGSSDTPEDTEQQITEGQVTEDRIAEDQATEDQVTEDQIAEDQTTEDTGDDQKSTVENNLADNNPADNDSKPDNGANLPSEDNSHSVWILVICASVGILMFGLGLYLGYRNGKKIDKK